MLGEAERGRSTARAAADPGRSRSVSARQVASFTAAQGVVRDVCGGLGPDCAECVTGRRRSGHAACVEVHRIYLVLVCRLAIQVTYCTG